MSVRTGSLNRARGDAGEPGCWQALVATLNAPGPCLLLAGSMLRARGRSVVGRSRQCRRALAHLELQIFQVVCWGSAG